MSKIASYVMLVAISLSILACGKTNQDDVTPVTKRIAEYAESKSLDSLQILGDSIIANENLGEAIIAQLKDTTVAISSAAMAISIAPEKAAQILFEDIKAMKKEDKATIKSRVRSLLSWYSELKQEAKAKKFSESLDAMALELDIEKQAQCYVMVASSPAFLVSMINNDEGENKEELIKAIEKAYSDNKEDLTQFHNALKK